MVNCTEVAEHVDPKYLHVFLDNLRKITGKYLILTWSSTYPPHGAPPQHVSPLPSDDVIKIMNEWGFELDHKKSTDQIRKIVEESSKNFKAFEDWE